MQASFHQGAHHHLVHSEGGKVDHRYGDYIEGVEGVEGVEDNEVLQHERGERNVPRREESTVGGGK